MGVARPSTGTQMSSTPWFAGLVWLALLVWLLPLPWPLGPAARPSPPLAAARRWGPAPLGPCLTSVRLGRVGGRRLAWQHDQETEGELLGRVHQQACHLRWRQPERVAHPRQRPSVVEAGEPAAQVHRS